MKSFNALHSALLIAGLSAIPLSATPVTFGQGLEKNGSQEFHLLDTGSGVTLSASSQTYYIFSNATGTLPSRLTTEGLSFALSSVVPSFVGNVESTPHVLTPGPVSMLIIGVGMMLIGAVGVRMRRNVN